MDLTGGMGEDSDEVTADRPEGPDYREGVSMWIWDDAGRVALPRLAVEAAGATWETAWTATANVALPDGRVLLAWAYDPPDPTSDSEGRPRMFGAGPLRFQCIEPFARWRLVFDGDAMQTTAEDQITGRTPQAEHPGHVVGKEGGRGAEAATEVAAAAAQRARAALGQVPLYIEMEGRMVAPPWVQGSLGGDGFIPGEHRFEQLFAAEGVVRIAGEETTFKGGGLRIHRRGGNRTNPSDFFGHCWHSAFFPSGRAFGFIHYHPRPDGLLKFCEGWVIQDGRRMPAQALDTPWMQQIEPGGEPFSFTLRTSEGDIMITAETWLSAFFPLRRVREDVTFPPLQQGIARYRWDGEEAFGMIERSAYLESR